LQVQVEAVRTIASRHVINGSTAGKGTVIAGDKYHPAGACSVQAASRPPDDLHRPDIIKPELIEERVTSGIGVRYVIVVHFDIPDAERRTQGAASYIQTITSGRPFFHSYSRSGIDCRNKTG